MVVSSLPKKKVLVGDEEAGFVQLEVAAMDGRKSYLLQQCKKVRNDESSLPSVVRWHKDKGKQVKRDGAIVRLKLLVVERKIQRSNVIKVRNIGLRSLREGLQVLEALGRGK